MHHQCALRLLLWEAPSTFPFVPISHFHHRGVAICPQPLPGHEKPIQRWELKFLHHAFPANPLLYIWFYFVCVSASRIFSCGCRDFRTQDNHYLSLILTRFELTSLCYCTNAICKINLRDLQGSCMLMHGSQVWHMFWLAERVKMSYRKWCHVANYNLRVANSVEWALACNSITVLITMYTLGFPVIANVNYSWVCCQDSRNSAVTFM